MKKILFLSAWYPNRYDSMAGLFVQRHAETLSQFYDISILYTHGTSAVKNNYETEISTENGLFTVCVYYRKVATQIPGLSHILKLYRLFKAHRIGFKEIRNRTALPDLVHLNILTRVGIFALYLKIKYNIPYVITEHWSRYLPERNEFKGLLRKIATKIIVRHSSGISTVSERLKAAMKACGISHKNFLVVPNVVDTEVFRPIPEIPSANKPLIFSHISCFDNKAKNTNGIVRAIAELTKHRDDFLCLMVGDGPDKPEAVHLAEQLGILNRTIRFTGLLEGKELMDTYKQSLFTFLFSNYENMPVVISESFSCGKPVIATNVGGISEIVNETTGILISPGNEEKLVSAINYMLDNYSKFDATLIRNYAIAQFGKEAVYKQLENLYQSVRQ